MKLLMTPRIIAAAVALAVSLPGSVQLLAWPYAQQAEPDNTKINKRDRSPREATADRQKMNAADQKLTAEIRKAVIADKSLSTYGHNVKIISRDGVVTLKGPVRTAAEAESILAKATASAGGPGKIVNQMAVKR